MSGLQHSNLPAGKGSETVDQPHPLEHPLPHFTSRGGDSSTQTRGHSQNRARGADDGEEEEGCIPVNRASTPEPQRYSSHTPSTVCRRGGGRHLSLPNSSQRSVAPERVSAVYAGGSGGGNIGTHAFAATAGGISEMRHTTMLFAAPPEEEHPAGSSWRSGPATAPCLSHAGFPLWHAAARGTYLSPSAQPLRLSEGASWRASVGRATAMRVTDPQSDVGWEGPPARDGIHTGESARWGATLPLSHAHRRGDGSAMLGSPSVNAPTQAPVISADAEHDAFVASGLFSPAKTVRGAGEESGGDDAVLIAQPTQSPLRRRTGRLSTVVEPPWPLSMGHPHDAALDMGIDDGNSVALMSSASAPKTMPRSRGGGDEEGGDHDHWGERAGQQHLYGGGSSSHFLTQESQLLRRHHHHRHEHVNEDRNASSSSPSSSSSLLSTLAELEQAPRKSYTRDAFPTTADGGDLCASVRTASATGFVRDISDEDNSPQLRMASPWESGRPLSSGDAVEERPRALHDMDSFGVAAPPMTRSNRLFEACFPLDAADRMASVTTSSAGCFAAVTTNSSNTASISHFFRGDVALAPPPGHVSQAAVAAPSFVPLSDAPVPSASQTIIIPPPSACPAQLVPIDRCTTCNESSNDDVVCSAGGGLVRLSHISVCEDVTQESVSAGAPHASCLGNQQQGVRLVDVADQFAHLNLQGSPTQKRLAFDEADDESGFRSGCTNAHGQADEAEEETGGLDGVDVQRQGGVGDGGRSAFEYSPHWPGDRWDEPDRLFTTAPRTTPASPLDGTRKPGASSAARQRFAELYGNRSQQTERAGDGQPVPADAMAARRAAVMGSRPTGLQLLQSRKRSLAEMSAAPAEWPRPPNADALPRPGECVCRTGDGRDDDADGGCEESGPFAHQRQNSSPNSSVELEYLATIKRCRREYEQQKRRHQQTPSQPAVLQHVLAQGGVLQELPANTLFPSPQRSPQQGRKASPAQAVMARTTEQQQPVQPGSVP